MATLQLDLPRADQPPRPRATAAVVGQRLTADGFTRLAGRLGGYPFVKLVVERASGTVHFLNDAVYKFHADYIAECLLGVPSEQLDGEIDSFNRSVYFDTGRRFYLGILALHQGGEGPWCSLETVEIDTMGADMIRPFFAAVRSHLDPALPLRFKPANHDQESAVAALPERELPRVFARELYAAADFVALNPGRARGRLRAFATEEGYRAARDSLAWHDILVMGRAPDDIPRLAGLINAEHTTPLSHTNVLASGWQVPNAVQRGILARVAAEGLDGAWVEYTVHPSAAAVELTRVAPPACAGAPPWRGRRVSLEEPDTQGVAIRPLAALRAGDRRRVGTKAANLGELCFVRENGSDRLTGFYRAPRPPRPNLLPYLRQHLGVPEGAEPGPAAAELLRAGTRVPRGIALPFALQRRFLESSPELARQARQLTAALEAGVGDVGALCIGLQRLIHATPFPDGLGEEVCRAMARHLPGASRFVVRSSSNAEDLDGLSAAGVYESFNRRRTLQEVLVSVKAVWASLVSPRGVRLRQEAGIAAGAAWMGVVIQEEVEGGPGGVLVTTNPLDRGDFRNVYLNVSAGSVQEVVQGGESAACLFNAVEGGGRTLSAGPAGDLPAALLPRLQRLAIVGRLLQGHFAPDDRFASPLDIEWIVNDDGIHLLQVRPFGQGGRP